MPTLKDKAIISADPQFVSHIPTEKFRVIKRTNEFNKTMINLFITVAASSLVEYANEIRKAMDTKQFRILFLREDISLDWLPAQLLNSKLPTNKLLPKILLYSDWSVPERVIKAWAGDSQDVLIANARVTEECLIVSSCALEKLKIPFSVKVLRDLPVKERNKFEIDNAGSFIHWPESDIDLDLDALRYLVDPQFKKKSDAERMLVEEKFGHAVKVIRELNKLTQEDIQSKAGISERQLRRYETEGIKPRVSSLERLAKAHDMDLNTYLTKLAKVINETD